MKCHWWSIGEDARTTQQATRVQTGGPMHTGANGAL